MFARVRLLAGGLFLASAIGTSMPAGAVTADLNIQTFGRSDRAVAQDAMQTFLGGPDVRNTRIETFEGLHAWDGTSGTSNPQNTAVGSFTTLGGLGTGGSVVNGGHSLEVRGDNSMAFGRYDTSLPAGSLGGNWLDTNDTYGIEWTIGGVGKFNAISFMVTDASDRGAAFSLDVGGQSFSSLAGGAAGRTADGNIQYVMILLDEAVETLTVKLSHDRLNDGFGLDGAAVAHIAPVPLPPAAALMLGGVAALAGLRRWRRKSATA